MADTPNKSRSRKGDGSVKLITTRTGQKVWRAALRFHDHDGRPVYTSRVAATEAQARQALKELRDARDAGIKAPRRTYKVADLMNDWLEGKRADVATGKLSVPTLLQYEYATTRVLHGLDDDDKGLGHLEASRLFPETVQAFLDRARLHYSPRTAALFRTAMFGACRRAVRLRLLATNPVASADSIGVKPASGEGGVRAMSAEQVAKFLTVAEGDPLYALWAVYFSLGLRRGEALGLRWSDYDRASGMISIRRSRKKEGAKVVEGDLKTAASRRDLPVGPGLAAILEVHREQQLANRTAWLAKGARVDGDSMFTEGPGHPLDPDEISHRFKRICVEAGIGEWHLHETRHTAITLALRGGMSFDRVKRLAGHSSVRVTIDTYSHLGSEDLRQGVNALDSVLHSRSGR